jgi:mevalonate kinase
MASAGGKVIVLGEHAVVYGVPAIAAGLDRGAEATASVAERAEMVIDGAVFRPDDASELGRAFGALLSELGAPAFRVAVKLAIPTGAGLGASAAIGVATARAVQAACDRPDDGGAVLRAASAWEAVFHGNPSGIDTAAAAIGGCLWFVRGEGPKPLVLGAPLTLAIAVAGPPASTKQMVDSVARLRARRPELVEKAFEGIRSLVENGRRCIESGDVTSLGKLLDLNQMILAGLHVSTEDIERACAIAREAGALGCKLTGAGGGGCVIALVDADPEPVLAAWKQAGYEAFSAVIR